MPEFFQNHPGWTYLAAMVLPLLVGTGTLLTGAAKRPARMGTILNVGALAAAAMFALLGLFEFLIRGSWESVGERVEWLRLGPPPTGGRAVVLSLGYFVDRLTAVLFAAVAVVALLVAVSSLGGPGNAPEPVEGDRPGRRGRFLAAVSVLTAATFALLLADNLVQMFACGQLLGMGAVVVLRRDPGQPAAPRAFAVIRAGDAGFLVAVLIAWTAFGTGNLDECERSAEVVRLVHQRIRPGLFEGMGPDLGLLPERLTPDQQEEAAGLRGALREYHGISRPVWVLLGLGLFLGTAALAAQVPLHGWLADAAAGPPPMLALIPAATTGAAGVYVVVRCHFLFAPEAFLVVAYTGAVTMFAAAAAACVQTDLRRVVAYAAGSQLGFVLLAVGVAGFGAGTFHLVTVIFDQALLALGAAAVIGGVRYEHDFRYLGGLGQRMPVTAVAMLVGVLAVWGCPPLAGWASKDAVLTAAAHYVVHRPPHAALLVLPLLATGLTAFALFRLWFLVFAGAPRDPELASHARPAPPVLSGPLLALAVLCLMAGIGWPVWEPGASYLGRALGQTTADGSFRYGYRLRYGVFDPDGQYVRDHRLAMQSIAGLAAASGAALAAWLYLFREPHFTPDPPGRVRAFLLGSWGVDALWDRLLVRPTLWLARRLAGPDM